MKIFTLFLIILILPVFLMGESPPIAGNIQPLELVGFAQDMTIVSFFPDAAFVLYDRQIVNASYFSTFERDFKIIFQTSNNISGKEYGCTFVLPDT